jgi:hypothetical protein
MTRLTALIARTALTALVVFSTVGCPNYDCPPATEPLPSGRCVPIDEEALADAATPDGSVGEPDAEAITGTVTIEVPDTPQRLARGGAIDVALHVSQGPSYFGPIELTVDALPEGITGLITPDPASPTLRLAASPSVATETFQVTVRGHVVGAVEIAGEASFDLRVVGARGTLDESLDGDGIRADTPLDGTRDRVVGIAVDDEDGVILVGNGQADGTDQGFVTWYDADGIPVADMADAGTRRVQVLAERTQIRGFLPTPEGTLLALEVGIQPRMIRLTPEGRDDRRFETDPTVARPSANRGGSVLPHDHDGFVIRFSQQLERYNFGGMLDHAFGTHGVVPVPSGVLATGAALPDGSIVVGATQTGGYWFRRYDRSGQPDHPFGTAGLVEIAAPYGIVRSMIPLDGGGFVATTGSANFTTPADVTSRLYWITRTGALDTRFGEGGILVFTDGTTDRFWIAGGLRSGDRLHVFGTRRPVDGQRHGFVAAMSLDGVLDRDFGDAGFTDLGPLVHPEFAAVEADGERLVLGCDRPLGTASDATRTVAIARVWL